MGNVVQLNVKTTFDLSADTILTQAVGKLAGVMVIGFDKDGEEWVTSSMGSVGDILFLLERAKALTMASVVSVPD
jgi:hypothetical protein